MNIVHLINLAGFGGVEKRFSMFIENSNFDNHIICMSNNIDERISSLFKDKKIIFANKITKKSKIKYPTILRARILEIRIKKINPDILLVWDFIPKLNLDSLKCKVIYYDCGCGWRYPINKKTNYFFSKIDSVISNSYASKRVIQLRYNFNKHIKVVLNKLNLIVSDRVKEKPTNHIVLGTASRLIGLKGIGVSILTIKELIDSGINASLLIAGDGEDREKLEHLVSVLSLQNNIRFLGFQSDLTDFYEHIDIYLSTPVTEAFGLSCIEAMSHGVPVIFPMIDGQPEAIKDNYCGIAIVPTVSIDKYKEQTGISIDFPYQVYDPNTDSLTSIKLISPEQCMLAVKNVLHNYEQLSKNALKWSKETMNYNVFIKEFESATKDEH